MRIDIIAKFPEYFNALNLSLMNEAQKNGLLTIVTHNLSDWKRGAYSVDDSPVGGGAGMIMKPEIWASAIDDVLAQAPAETPETAADGTATTASADASAANSGSANSSSANPGSANSGSANPNAVRPIIIFPNPSAPTFAQKDATELSKAPALLFGCGRSEGIDARVPAYYAQRGYDVREYSIGEYVLNGGEVAVCVMIEAITRLIPGFMHNPESIVSESYTGEQPLLEYPQYTRPTTWRGLSVPDVLLSGDHGKVNRYHRDESIRKTARLRPDLIAKLDCHALDKADRKLLMSLGWEVSGDHPRILPKA